MPLILKGSLIFQYPFLRITFSSSFPCRCPVSSSSPCPWRHAYTGETAQKCKTKKAVAFTGHFMTVLTQLGQMKNTFCSVIKDYTSCVLVITSVFTFVAFHFYLKLCILQNILVLVKQLTFNWYWTGLYSPLLCVWHNNEPCLSRTSEP